MMKPLRHSHLQLLLKFTAGVGSLWTLFLLTQLQTGWSPSYLFSYGGLDYSEDGGPASACNCSAILRGDPEEMQKAKLLSITRDFRRSVRVPDEFYINATGDCRHVCCRIQLCTVILIC